MASIAVELRTLVAKLEAEGVSYALCGALALAVLGHPRATLDIDLLALGGSSENILRCGRTLGFTLPAATMRVASGTVRIDRLSKAFAGEQDVIMLDVLSLPPEVEAQIIAVRAEWEGVVLSTVSRESLIRLKRLRGSLQDQADIEKLS